jgi:hypothetical protein
MKLWIDDVRSAPEGYHWDKTVNDAKRDIEWLEESYNVMMHQYLDRRANLEDVEFYKLEIIDIDHDAGDYACSGGDYIKLLNWLEETGRNYPIHIHTDNAVARERMRAIIERNGWTEVK